MGWHEQGDGNHMLGVNIEQVRVRVKVRVRGRMKVRANPNPDPDPDPNPNVNIEQGRVRDTPELRMKSGSRS